MVYIEKSQLKPTGNFDYDDSKTFDVDINI